MTRLLLTSAIFLTACIYKLNAAQTLRFANYYDNHMVLQMSPKQAQVWGYASTVGDTVFVTLNGANVANATVKHGSGSMGVWSALLPPQNAGGHATLEIKSHDGHVKLTNVMFGDVWVCSGQSNMVFPMYHVLNQSYELELSSHFHNIRFMAVKTSRSNSTLAEPAISTRWQMPTVNDVGTQHFSAVCLLYAMNIAPHINRPIGLVQTAYGGTMIEAWSSPDAIATCGLHDRKGAVVGPLELWNAMLFPLLKMTIYGVLWYQGESNSGYYQDYMCQFPAMIDDWREKFHAASHQQSSKTFPFGFVQLAAVKNQTIRVAMPDLRWAQTAGYGYVPNPVLQNVFMAVAMDLPDYASPYGSVHPRDKMDVAERLALAGRAVAYGESNIDFQGPIPSKFTLNSDHTLTIEFDHGNNPIEVRKNNGFEVCCSHLSNETCKFWQYSYTNITHHDQTSVTIDTSVCHGYKSLVTSVKYAWEMSPCEFKMCAIYGRDNDLPVSGFKASLPRHAV
ncbi:sialate O-acetylesterase-like isoform X2 [Mercenaria mercenaria]|uniref:sialate O-acetylesterase-like isoform X2 n=1 Tax=Mercenaria mercenaria TaxID=6596 RepID=UPI00234F8FED|nr:sialate O-acetylesterase-like isoform X2 [Mercenaria mercenaria]